MALVYVDSNAAGTASGADWANACLTLNAGFTAAAAGDTIYVAHNHAETAAAATTITAKGSDAAPCRVICVNSAGSVPPVSADLRTTATITTTGANALTLSGAANCYFEGITLRCGSGAVNSVLSIGTSNDTRFKFKNCGFKKLGTNSSSTAITVGASTGRSRIDLENTTLEFSNVSDGLSTNGALVWVNTTSALAGSVLTTGLVNMGTTAQFTAEGVDFSLLTPGTSSLVRTMGSGGTQIVRFKNCKLGASVAFNVPTIFGPRVEILSSDSGDTNYRSEIIRFQGTLTTETTTVRTGGASDGTTTIAWKIVPTANNERDFPFECFPISIWNETTGSAVTLTIEGYWSGGAVPTTADVWMDVDAMTTSGFPISATASGGPADSLAAGTNHTTSTETWGAGGTTKFKMAVSVTPQEKGPIAVYIKYANATETCWIDPKITVS